MKKRKHGEELETGGASYFGSGVREDFFEEDVFKFRPVMRKASLQSSWKSISGRGS